EGGRRNCNACGNRGIAKRNTSRKNHEDISTNRDRASFHDTFPREKSFVIVFHTPDLCAVSYYKRYLPKPARTSDVLHAVEKTPVRSRFGRYQTIRVRTNHNVPNKSQK